MPPRFVYVLLVFMAGTVVFFGCTDNLISRRAFNMYVDSLASKARARPDRPEYAKALVAIARRPTTTSAEKHHAMVAAHALRSTGRAVSHVLYDMVGLLDCPYGGVSQATAISLMELGPTISPVVDDIAARIKRGPLDATAWFAVQALAHCGAAAEKHLPLLRDLQGHEPAMFTGTVADAIADIEAALEDTRVNSTTDNRKAEKDRHSP